MSEYNPLISVTSLIENFDHDKLIILDATTPKSIFSDDIAPGKQIISNSLLFDLVNDFSNKSSSLPNALPNVEQMTASVQALGIDHDSYVVIYDARGAFSGPRAWWLLKSYGLEYVFLLNGGTNAWQQMGYPWGECYQPKTNDGNFIAKLNPTSFVDKADVLDFIQLKEETNTDAIELIDVRSVERFQGKVAETREGLRAGHIPFSLNLPFTRLLYSEDRSFISHDLLCAEFENLLGRTIQELKDNHTRLIFSCGSGMTACIALLAAKQIGLTNLAVYDGSWAEWGADQSLPIVCND